MKFRDLRKELREDGWVLKRQVGSHQQWTHLEKPGLRVTIAGHDSDEVPAGTLKNIRRQQRGEK